MRLAVRQGAAPVIALAIAVLVALAKLADTFNVSTSRSAAQSWPTLTQRVIRRCAQSAWYIFDHKDLHALTQRAVAAHGNDTARMTQYIISDLAARYPTWTINTAFAAQRAGDASEGEITMEKYEPNADEWFINNAGGAMGSLFIIHASITEYLIIFGTPLGSEGHSGRHPSDDYFMILQGEERAALPGAFQPEVRLLSTIPSVAVADGLMSASRTGLPAWNDASHAPRRGEAVQVARRWLRPRTRTGYVLALDHTPPLSRVAGVDADRRPTGWIPLMMPFGLADLFTSTLDMPTLVQTIRVTGREMLKNLLHGKI